MVAEPETLLEFMVGTVTEPETLREVMVRAVAGPETVVKFMVWAVAERETVIALMVLYGWSQSLRRSTNFMRGGRAEPETVDTFHEGGAQNLEMGGRLGRGPEIVRPH